MPGYIRMIVLLCLISSLGRFVLDSYLPSMPAIGAYFGVSHVGAEYTLTFYLFGFSISQLIYGPLSDHYGRRTIIITGLSIFVLGNLACALASTHQALLFARLIAGIGAGVCGVLNRAIANDCFQGAAFSKAWSYTTTTLVLTLCFAPIIGGFAEQFYGWRANFTLSTFYVGFVLLLIIKYLPETHHLSGNKHVGALTINEIMANYYEVLTTPSFITGTLCYTFSFAGIITYFQLSPTIFIEMLKLSPGEYGWCSAVVAINYLLGGCIVNYFVTRVGTYSLVKAGTFLLIAGGATLLFAYLFRFTNLYVILMASSIYILGARITIPNAIADSMRELRHLGGSSSALIGFTQMLGSSLVSLTIASLSHPPLLMLAIAFMLLGITTLLLTACMGEQKQSLRV